MKIIAECGATKGDWRLTGTTGDVIQERTEGINISSMSVSAIKAIIEDVTRRFGSYGPSVTDIHIYLAGVMTDSVKEAMTEAFIKGFPTAAIEFQDDMTAAARALCGNRPGIAAIIGTGSNSCLWDGEKIVARSCSGGFILGDEGSAAVLGRLFIADFIKGLVPEEIAEDFSSRFPSGYSTIVSNVYR